MAKQTRIFFSGREPELKFVDAETADGFETSWSTDEDGFSVLTVQPKA